MVTDRDIGYMACLVVYFTFHRGHGRIKKTVGKL